MLRTHEDKLFFSLRFVTALDLIKCLKQINTQRLILRCAPISEFPSNIRTMRKICKLCDKKCIYIFTARTYTYIYRYFILNPYPGA